MNFKQKLIDLFGGVGTVLYFIITLVSLIFPIAMITVSFNLPIWVNFIFVAILFMIPSLNFVFCIIGLIGAIIGSQDVIAIAYYIYFALVCILGFIPTIVGFFTKD